MIQNYHLLNPRTEIPVTQVQFLPQFLHNHEIREIQRLISAVPYESGAILGGDQPSNMVIRDSEIKWLKWSDENWWLYARIMDKVKALNESIWQFDLFGINEFLQYTEYVSKNSGRGHYDYHMDLADQGLPSTRKITVECVLEDEYEGGEFALLMGPSEQKVTLRKGDAVFYPSFLMNKIYPVKAGKRSSIVCWVSGPAFK